MRTPTISAGSVGSWQSHSVGAPLASAAPSVVASTPAYVMSMGSVSLPSMQ